MVVVSGITAPDCGTRVLFQRGMNGRRPPTAVFYLLNAGACVCFCVPPPVFVLLQVASSKRLLMR